MNPRKDRAVWCLRKRLSSTARNRLSRASSGSRSDVHSERKESDISRKEPSSLGSHLPASSQCQAPLSASPGSWLFQPGKPGDLSRVLLGRGCSKPCFSWYLESVCSSSFLVLVFLHVGGNTQALCQWELPFCRGKVFHNTPTRPQSLTYLRLLSVMAQPHIQVDGLHTSASEKNPSIISHPGKLGLPGVSFPLPISTHPSSMLCVDYSCPSHMEEFETSYWCLRKTSGLKWLCPLIVSVFSGRPPCPMEWEWRDDLCPTPALSVRQKPNLCR